MTLGWEGLREETERLDPQVRGANLQVYIPWWEGVLPLMNLKVEYLGKYKAIFQTVLGPYLVLLTQNSWLKLHDNGFLSTGST